MDTLLGGLKDDEHFGSNEDVEITIDNHVEFVDDERPSTLNDWEHHAHL